MGWGFRKSFKIAPGIRVNLSKRGVSTSFGAKGLTVNSRGKVTASIPGTGLSYVHTTQRSPSSRDATETSEGNRFMAEPQSKREEAAAAFKTTLNGRQIEAVENYFLSHAVYVESQDIGKAVRLDEHQNLFSGLNGQFSVTYRAIKLADDLGSISLAEKERAFSALYEIEEACESARGPHLNAMREAIYHLKVRLGELPQKPTFGLCYISVILGVGLLVGNVGTIWVALAPVGFGLALAAAKVTTFRARDRTARQLAEEARTALRSLTEHSVTQLP